MDAYVQCSGDIVTGAGGELVRQENLFRLGASSFADFVTVDLVTHTDVWLPYDLKGRHRQEVYTANGPRLAAVLRDLSEVLGSETDPDDSTYFAKPTETLGYLWASDAENAASFEPLDVGDNASYHAGLAWLERLRSAHDRGLSPSAALAVVSATADTSAGRVAPACEPRTVALAVLRDRSRG
ncbi:hypothetical protein [Streptomyces sp. Go-475]|uniref:hypothetical protein n=1 Tax=Streptomyces sp. Go-475 TaxID=2072505 RepID=UPI000DF04EE3|nr:hypothetical protein [Streptomyces sp. Go-475]AXE86053.1 hypothetical protein C1703_13655 [Streptomyces sp. Go-475]